MSMKCAKCGAVSRDPVLIFSKRRIAVSLLCMECAETVAAVRLEKDGP